MTLILYQSFKLWKKKKKICSYRKVDKVVIFHFKKFLRSLFGWREWLFGGLGWGGLGRWDWPTKVEPTRDPHLPCSALVPIRERHMSGTSPTTWWQVSLVSLLDVIDWVQMCSPSDWIIKLLTDRRVKLVVAHQNHLIFQKSLWPFLEPVVFVQRHGWLFPLGY